jgi:hypothetical protein
MVARIVVLDEGGKRVISLKKVTHEMLKLLIRRAPGRGIDVVHGRFIGAGGIVIWVDDAGRTDCLPIWATYSDEGFCGPIAITGTSKAGKYTGLTNKQIERVMASVEWVPGLVPPAFKKIHVPKWPTMLKFGSGIKERKTRI